MVLEKGIRIAVICAWIRTHGIFNLCHLFCTLFYVMKYTHFHVYVSYISLTHFMCLLPRNFLLPVGNWGKHVNFHDGPPWRAVWSCQMSGTGWHRRFFTNSSAIVLTQVSSSFSGVADVQRVLKTTKWSIKGCSSGWALKRKDIVLSYVKFLVYKNHLKQLSFWW